MFRFAAVRLQRTVRARDSRRFLIRSITVLKRRSDCTQRPVPIPEPEQLGLQQAEEKPDEWWVTLDGKPVIGFSGAEARPRAERHLQELLRVATPRSSSDLDDN